MSQRYSSQAYMQIYKCDPSVHHNSIYHFHKFAVRDFTSNAIIAQPYTADALTLNTFQLTKVGVHARSIHTAMRGSG